MEHDKSLRYGILVILALTAIGLWKVDKSEPISQTQISRTREKSGFEYKMVRPTYKPPVRDLEWSDLEVENDTADKKIADSKKKLAQDKKKTEKKNAKNDKKKKDQKQANGKAKKDITSTPPSSEVARHGWKNENNANHSNYNGGFGQVDAKNTNHMSANQWRLTLLGSPNLANMTKFVNEYNSGTIDEGDFYTICEELLRDNRQEAQLYTVQILGTIEHPRAFDLIVRFQGKLGMSAENLIITVFDSYKSLQKAPLISAVLRSDFEKVTIAKAAEFAYLISHKAAAKGGRSSQVMAMDRSKTPSLSSTESKWLSLLVRPLQALLENSDQEISQSAEVALSQLQLNGI